MDCFSLKFGILFSLFLNSHQGRAVAECQDGWQNFTDHCYYVPEIKQPCEAAEITCVMHGAHLTSINSEEERRFITDLIHSTQSTREAWVGLYKHYTGSLANRSLEERRQGWAWRDGSDVIDHVLNWKDNEPSGENGETCGRIDDGYLCDTGNNGLFHLVCKKETTTTTTTTDMTNPRPKKPEPNVSNLSTNTPEDGGSMVAVYISIGIVGAVIVGAIFGAVIGYKMKQTKPPGFMLDTPSALSYTDPSSSSSAKLSAADISVPLPTSSDYDLAGGGAAWEYQEIEPLPGPGYEFVGPVTGYDEKRGGDYKRFVIHQGQGQTPRSVTMTPEVAAAAVKPDDGGGTGEDYEDMGRVDYDYPTLPPLQDADYPDYQEMGATTVDNVVYDEQRVP